jgi:hypothetical protein
MTIVYAVCVKIDANDLRTLLDHCDNEELEELNVQHEEGQLELRPGLRGWGWCTHTATHRDTGSTYHVRLE